MQHLSMPNLSGQTNKQPLVSFGLPVYNGEKFLSRLFDSLIAQDYPNFELIIGDNLSTDRTAEICQQYAEKDERFKYVRHSENLGFISNFNRVLELSQGEYFRWIGDDDWIEPDYTRKCVDFLEHHPDMIAVTTEQDHVFDDGTSHYVEHQGKRLDSNHAYVRFQRMLWFLTADYGLIDPMYTMYRRSAMLKTHGLPLIPAQDHALVSELSLVGAFGHIPECLAHRRRHMYHADGVKENLYKHYEPKNSKKISAGYNTVAALTMWKYVYEYSMPMWQKLLCGYSILSYQLKVATRREIQNLRGRVRFKQRVQSLLR
jgi:glycosyltransferase involved in cell wall biosynthesis